MYWWLIPLILIAICDSTSSNFYHKYNLIERYSAGKFGEVWKAVENKIGAQDSYIIKRLFTEKGYHVYLSGLREIHFGTKLDGLQHVPKLVEYHEEKGNLWLVFEDGGASLHQLLYTADESQRIVPSDLQKYLTSIRGQNLTKIIMRQILEGVHEIHELEVIHRDIKPENIVMNLHSDDLDLLEDALQCLETKLVDYGSALDDESKAKYYPEGPSSKEETAEYEPPEVIFNDDISQQKRTQSYDIWSVGVIFLEMLLGTSKVFQADPKSVAVISMMMEKSDDSKLKQKAILFKALSNYCIYTPKNVAPFLFVNTTLSSVKCKNGTIHLPQQVSINKWGKSLLQWLLKWKPEERISAKKALSHAFFREDGGYKCNFCGKEFEFEEFLYYHLTTHHDPYPKDNIHYSPIDNRFQHGALPSGVELDKIDIPVWNNVKEQIRQLASGLELTKAPEVISFEVFQEDRRQYLAPS